MKLIAFAIFALVLSPCFAHGEFQLSSEELDPADGMELFIVKYHMCKMLDVQVVFKNSVLIKSPVVCILVYLHMCICRTIIVSHFYKLF